MYMKKDREALDAVLTAVSRLVMVENERLETLNEISDGLERLRVDVLSALDAAAFAEADAKLAEGISSIMNFTGAPKRGDKE